MLEKPVLRIKELSLCRFRGFVNCKPITLDTNADVILLTGPNGFGKTSLIDALCLLLTGHCYPERRPLTSCTKPPDANCSDSARIQVVVEYEGSEEKESISPLGMAREVIRKSRPAWASPTGFLPNWPRVPASFTRTS